MSTTQFTATVLGCYLDNVTLHMSPSDGNFFLSQITLDRNPSISDFEGCWLPGNPKRGGSRSVEVDQQDFTRLHDECALGTTVQVTLTYHLSDDETQYCVDNVDCMRIVVQAQYKRSPEAGNYPDPPAAVGDLAHTVQQQLLVQRQILSILQEARPSQPTPRSHQATANGTPRHPQGD